MTPLKQLYRHDPANGTIGDCCRTTLACLLDMRPEDIPHFSQTATNEVDETWESRRNGWLLTNGFYVVSLYHTGSLDETLATFGGDNEDLYWMLSGISKNGVGHTVICWGDQIVHDPALDESGIVRPFDDGAYIIEFLVPVRFTEQR